MKVSDFCGKGRLNCTIYTVSRKRSIYKKMPGSDNYFLKNIRCLSLQKFMKMLYTISRTIRIFQLLTLFFVGNSLEKRGKNWIILSRTCFSGIWNFPHFFPPVQHGKRSGNFHNPEKIVLFKNFLIFFSL